MAKKEKPPQRTLTMEKIRELSSKTSINPNPKVKNAIPEKNKK